MATAAGPPPPAPWGRGDGPAGLPLLHHAEGHNRERLTRQPAGRDGRRDQTDLERAPLFTSPAESCRLPLFPRIVRALKTERLASPSGRGPCRRTQLCELASLASTPKNRSTSASVL